MHKWSENKKRVFSLCICLCRRRKVWRAQGLKRSNHTSFINKWVLLPLPSNYFDEKKLKLQTKLKFNCNKKWNSSLSLDFCLKVCKWESEFRLRLFSSLTLGDEQQKLELWLESFLNPSSGLGSFFLPYCHHWTFVTMTGRFFFPFILCLILLWFSLDYSWHQK